jgi:hypothetical protein
MTDREQQIDRLRRRLSWESGGPLAEISNQATVALVTLVSAVVLLARRRGGEKPFITILLVLAAGFATGRVGGNHAQH